MSSGMDAFASPETPPVGGKGGVDADRCPASAPYIDTRLTEYLSSVKSLFISEKTGLSAATGIQQQGPDSDRPRSLHLVIGNEALDADSIVSAIVHAYLLHLVQLNGGDGNHSRPPESLVVPVASIQIRDLLTQRPETVFLLRSMAGVTGLEELLCDIDDLAEFLSVSASRDAASESVQSHDNVQEPRSSMRRRHRITLMDHNQLSSRLQAYGAKDPSAEPILEVVGIVDHHRDMGSHTDTCPNSPPPGQASAPAILARNIAFDEPTGHPLVASTCTLVVEELVRIMDEGRSAQDSNALRGSRWFPPPQVSVLLLGTILLDSINLDPRAGKVTDRDRAAVRELLRRTNWDGLDLEAKQALGMPSSPSPDAREPDCDVLFDLLQSAKFDPAFWLSLSVRDALRLDYKQFSTGAAPDSTKTVWGMSTVLLDVESFAGKPDWEQGISEYMAEYNLELLVVMLATSSAGRGGNATADSRLAKDEDTPAPLERALVLCDLRKGSIVDDLVDHLNGPRAPLDLKLVELPGEAQFLSIGNGSMYVRTFHQGNAKASRKQVAPILFDYFEARLALQSA